MASVDKINAARQKRFADRKDPFDLGFGKCVRAGARSIQIQTAHHGRIWVPRTELHPSSAVHVVGEEGAVRVRLSWAKEKRFA